MGDHPRLRSRERLVKEHKITGWLIFFSSCFLFLGITENLRSVFMPLIQRDLSLSEVQLSGLIVIGGLASILFQLSAGRLSGRLGTERVYQVALCFLIVALILARAPDRYHWVLLFFFILQAGITLYSIMSNSVIPTLGASAGRILTFCHGCYGLGAMLSPLVAERLLKISEASGGGWRESYQLLIYPAVALWALVIGLEITRRPLPRAEVSCEPPPRLITLLSTRGIWIFALLFGAGITAEVATSNWLVYYLCATQEMPRASAGIYLSTFYALFTLGRFIGSFTLKVGAESKILTVALISSCLMLTLGLLFPHLCGVFFALSGLSFALTFPMMLMSFNQACSTHQAHVLGVVISGALLVFISVNTLIGVWCSQVSVKSSYSLMIGCSLIALASHLTIERFKRSSPRPLLDIHS